MVTKCSAIARSGSRCNAPALPASTFCYLHDPTAEERRREASRRGGKARSNAARAAAALPPAMTSDDLLVTLSEAIRKVDRGELAPGPANAISSLARAMNSIRETTEIERRLSELEAQVAGMDTRWRA